MVQFLSINFFSWISSIFVVFQKFPYFCVTLYMDFKCSTYMRICFISTSNLKRKAEMSLGLSLISGMPQKSLKSYITMILILTQHNISEALNCQYPCNKLTVPSTLRSVLIVLANISFGSFLHCKVTHYCQEGMLHRNFNVLAFDLLYRLQALPAQGNVDKKKSSK